MDSMTKAWQILQLGQRSLAVRIVIGWRERAFKQRKGLNRRLVQFSKMRQKREEVARCKHMFRLLRFGVEIQLTQKPSALATEVVSMGNRLHVAEH